jgi:diguanylate cyclase
MDWSKIPDILAIALLAFAFSSISRRSDTALHRLWVAGWVLIAVHFLAFMLLGIPGVVGLIGQIVGLTALVAAGIAFMWATIPYETGISCRRMASVVFLSMFSYIVLASLPHVSPWAFDVSAAFIGLGPLVVGLVYIHFTHHTLRWVTVTLQLFLGAALLVIGRVFKASPSLGINAILFAVYFGCCLYFWYTHRHRTTGSIIAVGGFFAWSLVFIISPALQIFRPDLHLESELWNLPKYIVAVGMLLLMLESQIERSQYLALHDDLTTLANRRLFQDRLSNAIERARRSKTSMALLQIDLDHFKAVNDSHGHHAGDLVLQCVAGLLESRVRRSDTIARTGGDEFSVILEEPSRRQEAELVAEDLVRILSEPIEVEGTLLRVGASIGIAVFPQDAESAENLCIAADSNMYQVKQHGREMPQVVRESPSGRILAS